MKKTILFFLLLMTLLLLSTTLFVSADDITTPTDEIKVVLDGKQLSFDVPPQIIEGRTMVPMRAIFEAMGAEVEWRDKTKTVIATKDSTYISMQIGNPLLLMDYELKTLDVPPQIVDGRTLVPVRAVAESFEADVAWERTTRTVIITSKKAYALLAQVIDKPKLFYSKQKDWYISIDSSFDDTITNDDRNMWVTDNSQFILYFDDAVDPTLDILEYGQRKVEEFDALFSDTNLDVKITRNLECITLNSMEFAIFSLRYTEDDVTYYSDWYYTKWNNMFFYFMLIYDENAEKGQQPLFDILSTFNPKANQSETQSYINEYLSELPTEKGILLLPAILYYSNSPSGMQMHTLTSIVESWPVIINHTYGRYEGSGTGISYIASYDTSDSSMEEIKFIVYQNVGDEASIDEVADYLLERDIGFTHEIVSEMKSETMQGREYKMATYRFKNTYYTIYLTENDGVYFEFTYIGKNETPPAEFFTVLNSFQP